MQKIPIYVIEKLIQNSDLGMTFEKIDATPCFSVFHKHEWHGGYESRNFIEVLNNGSLQDDKDFVGPRRIFYSDMQEMLRFLYEFLQILENDEGIIAPFYRYSPFVFNARENDIYHEILSFLHKNKLRKNSRSGVSISVNNDWDTVIMMVEGAFRDVSQLCMFMPKSKLLIVPNHHFELLFLSKEIKGMEKMAQEMIKQYTDLRFCGTGNDK